MMARLADSERVLWELTEKNQQLRTALLDMQKVLVIVARRQAGVLVITPEEMTELPAGAVLRCAYRPDGHAVIRVEYGEQAGEPGQPGREG